MPSASGGDSGVQKHWKQNCSSYQALRAKLGERTEQFGSHRWLGKHEFTRLERTDLDQIVESHHMKRPLARPLSFS